MGHHSSDDNEGFGEMPPHARRALHGKMRELLGEFPDGKLNQHDEGAVAFLVGVEDGRVKLQFPKPIAWIGMTPDEAVGMAELLIRHARKAGSTKPLQLHIA